MIGESTSRAVVQAVKEELAFSKVQHEEKFHSLHEAESIIREELEELEERVEQCRGMFEHIHEITRGTAAGMAYDADGSANSAASILATYAELAAEEAIQLAAMCLKLVEMAGREDEV